MTDTLREQVAQAIFTADGSDPAWLGDWGDTQYADEADAAIAVVLAAVEDAIAALRQRHVDDHDDCECVTTREIAYGEVRVAIEGLGV